MLEFLSILAKLFIMELQVNQVRREAEMAKYGDSYDWMSNGEVLAHVKSGEGYIPFCTPDVIGMYMFRWQETGHELFPGVEGCHEDRVLSVLTRWIQLYGPIA